MIQQQPTGDPLSLREESAGLLKALQPPQKGKKKKTKKKTTLGTLQIKQIHVLYFSPIWYANFCQ